MRNFLKKSESLSVNYSMFGKPAKYGRCLSLVRLFAIITLASGYFLFAGCAQIVTPGGGPKDIIPPQVEKYIPDSAATNFKSKNIVISFNEFIQLNDLQKELTISPPMNIQPEVKVKGKMLFIEIKDSLKQNTTYTLNFGNALRDFTENNIKTGFQYIFSTGSYIDTLKLSGAVKNALDQKTDKGILVMLYESFDDSIPYKKGPFYFAKTSADGSYRITNIRPGTYKAFALKDANENYKYDSPAENIGFSDTLIKISRNTKLNLQLFKEEPKKQMLLKSSVRGYGNTMLIYAKPVREISYKPLNAGTKTETFITEFSPNRDSIQVWFPVFPKDTLYFTVITDEKTMDTIRIATSQFKKDGGSSRGETFKLNMTANVSKDKKYEINKGLILRFNHPIDLNNSNLKNVYLTSLSKRIDYTNLDSVKINDQNFVFKFPLEQDSTYQLHVLPSAFKDIFNLTNDTFKVNFQEQDEKYYGTLKLNLKIKSKSGYLLDLMNEKGEIFPYGGVDKNVFSYFLLPPGNYRLRIIYDKNGDGKWTSGNYIIHQQPEKVIYYPGSITIRSNWDLELEWIAE
jgi:uncharacterized protein (DUF2141 family)